MERLTSTNLVRRNSRHLGRVLTGVAVLFTLAATVNAIPVDQYHSNLRQAVSALDSLSVADETESDEAYDTRRTETIAGVRRLLPGTQTIESGESTVTVNNSWLHLELDKFAKAKNEERPELLRQITERLHALDQRVDELEKASPISANDKAEANRKLKEILLRPEFSRKAKGQSALSRLMERLLKWFQSLFPAPKPISPGRAGVFSKIAQVVVVVLAVGVLALVLKMFLPRLMRNRKPRKKVKQEARIVLGETLEPDQSALDLLSEAEGLARRGELRAAIRKAYIALLVELGDRKVIHLAEHKTNRDYLSAVYSNQPLYGNVRQLTDSFERHWYGLAQASESDWQAFRSTYQRTLG